MLMTPYFQGLGVHLGAANEKLQVGTVWSMPGFVELDQHVLGKVSREIWRFAFEIGFSDRQTFGLFDFCAGTCFVSDDGLQLVTGVHSIEVPMSQTFRSWDREMELGG